MRASFLVITGLFLASFTAHAQTTLQAFTWQQNARFELRFTQKSGPVVLKGELRDGARQTYQTKDLQTTAEIKSYTTELFVVIAITNENDDSGSIFLLERPQNDWLLMNRAPFRARKLEIMTDFETAVKDFKTVTNHTFANIMRKMVEYFEKYPTKRMQDLLSSLETKEEFLSVLPRPRGPAKGNELGVIPGSVPSANNPSGTNPPSGNVIIITPNGPTTYTVPSPGGTLDDDQISQQPRRQPVRRLPTPPPAYQPYNPSGTIPSPGDSSGDDWVQRERRQQQRRRQPLREIDPYTGAPRLTRPDPYYPSNGPLYNRPTYQQRPPSYPAPTYAPRPQYAPRPRGFFESIFGQ